MKTCKDSERYEVTRNTAAHETRRTTLPLPSAVKSTAVVLNLFWFLCKLWSRAIHFHRRSASNSSSKTFWIGDPAENHHCDDILSLSWMRNLGEMSNDIISD